MAAAFENMTRAECEKVVAIDAFAKDPDGATTRRVVAGPRVRVRRPGFVAEGARAVGRGGGVIAQQPDLRSAEPRRRIDVQRDLGPDAMAKPADGAEQSNAVSDDERSQSIVASRVVVVQGGVVVLECRTHSVERRPPRDRVDRDAHEHTGECCRGNLSDGGGQDKSEHCHR